MRRKFLLGLCFWAAVYTVLVEAQITSIPLRVPSAAPSGPAGGVLGGTYPNPSFAATISAAPIFSTGTTVPAIDFYCGAMAGPARNCDVRITQYNNGSGYSGGFRGRSARGTFAAPTATQAGDNIASFFGQGYGATGFVAINTVGGPGLELIAKQNFTDSAAGTWMGMFTVPNGTVSTVESQRWDHDGSSIFNANGATGIVSPVSLVSSVTSREPQLLMTNSGASNWGMAVRGRASRGTPASPTATQNGDTLFSFYGNGRGLNAWGEDLISGFGGAGINIFAAENYSNTAMGAEMLFCVIPNTTIAVSCPVYLLNSGAILFQNSSAQALVAWTASTLDPQLASGVDFKWSSSATDATASKDTGLARNAAGILEVNNGTPGTFRDLRLRTPNADTYASSTNCSDGTATPADCAAAPAGSITVAASATSVVVNTTAVTANSQIFVMYDASLGTKLSVTCNTTIPALYGVTARTAGTSFTLSATAPVTNPACFSYFIVN